MGDRTCPLCRSSRVRPLFTKQQIDYWLCGACSFRFATADVNPNLANALDDYEDAYLQYLQRDAADEANFAALHRWMSSFAPIGGTRLLDVGAGSGKLVRDLRRRGVDARGIEPSRALFDRFLANDEAFEMATADAVRGTFDVVTAFDVIEHVADPHAFAESIVARLAPDGVLFLSTPDVESAVARMFGRHWHFYYPYHLSYFGPQTLGRLAADHGLTIVSVTHRGRLRSIGYVIRYAAEFVGGRSAPPWARRFDARYLPINLFDTMYVVLRRAT
ncbi:MAG TPA: class I SAM-dependent methyltransferase [Vicinamibacterales bacterium]|nr:class I SAM-dependent methyltransferase [Vicinamibacterales bacterium]